MNIRIERLNPNDWTQLQAVAKWDCDRELYHLVTPIRDKEAALRYPAKEEVLKKYQDPLFSKKIYVIWDDQKPIGHLSIQIDPPHLLKKVKQTSWLGLIIGEREYWGTGAARSAMSLFEQKSVQLQFNRVELGVFEFNDRAQRFYKNLGYREIGRIKNFTYYDGCYWDDVRMEKVLDL